MNRFLAALTSRVASSRSREAPARVAVDAAGAPPPVGALIAAVGAHALYVARGGVARFAWDGSFAYLLARPFAVGARGLRRLARRPFRPLPPRPAFR